MEVLEIELMNYRNIDNVCLSFGPGITVITGANAQGKTNLIEAIYYLSSGRSFRGVGDKQLIQTGRESARLLCRICAHGRDTELEARLSVSRRRELYAGGVRLKRAGDLAGKFCAVVFTPDDLDLIKSGPSSRRRLIDGILSYLRPRYAASLAEYNRLHDHKTRILKEQTKKPSLLEALDEYNDRLAQEGAILIYYRKKFVTLLSHCAGKINYEFTRGDNLELEYVTVSSVSDFSKSELIYSSLLRRQLELREREIVAGTVLTGACRDDIDIKIGGRSAKIYGSQGQIRSASISLKLAQRELIYEDRHEYPILLLDDVLSELDERRRNFLLNGIFDGQVFITACEESGLANQTGGTVIRIDGGAIV